MGLVGRIFKDGEATKQAAIELAQKIAIKSPVAIQGSKVCLNYSRDHSIAEGLNLNANWNMVMIQSEDVIKATEAINLKSQNVPTFSDL
jgi:peroxisomal enoyl coenzyme A hydratase 1 (fragment)